MNFIDQAINKFGEWKYQLGEQRYRKSVVAWQERLNEWPLNSRRSSTETQFRIHEPSLFIDKTFTAASEEEDWIKVGLVPTEKVEAYFNLLRDEAETARQRLKGLVLDKRLSKTKRVRRFQSNPGRRHISAARSEV